MAGLGVAADRVHEPLLRAVGRLFDHPHPHGSLGNPFRQGERDERAGEAKDQRIDQQSVQIQVHALGIQQAVDAEHRKDDAEDQEDGEIDAEEQKNSHDPKL